MSVTLFLGAGASKAFDLPTTTDFYKKVKSNFNTYPQFQDVVNYYIEQEKIKEDEIDIEKILWSLKEINDVLTKISTTSDFTKWLFYKRDSPLGSHIKHDSYYKGINELIKNINKVVYQTYWKTNYAKSSQLYIQLFAFLIRKQKELNIYTTNYDLCVEHVFWDNWLSRDLYSDGFTADGIDYSFNKDIYESKQYKLYKLHGSLNWKLGAKNKIVRINTPNFTEHEEHVIVFPGFKGIPEKEPYVFMHRALEDSLMKSDCCVAIGFSFRDEFINSIFSKVFEKNPEFRIIIWNPNPVPHPFPENNIQVLPKYFEEESINLLTLLI